MLNTNCFIFITGGTERLGECRGDVFDYDPDADKWNQVGQLALGRSNHAMSLVPKETADYCLSDRCMELTEYLYYK